MLTRLTELEEITGKVIVRAVESVYSDSLLVLYFTDDTYICFQAFIEYATPEIRVHCDELSDEEQKNLDLITEDEYNDRYEEKERLHLQAVEQRERKELERLKKKYEREGEKR